MCIRWFCFNGYLLNCNLIIFCLGCLNCNVFSLVAHSLKKSGRVPDEILEIYFCFSVAYIFLHFADQIHQDPVPLFCPLALSKV